MSNGNSPNPLTPNQDDLEYLRRLATVVLPTLLRIDATVDSTGFQRFLLGASVGTLAADTLGGNYDSSSHAPTLAAPGTGAGTGGSAVLLTGRISNIRYAASNATGTLRLTTGTGCAANANIVTVNFGNTITAAGATPALLFMGSIYPRVFLTPADKVTRQAAGPLQHPIAAPNTGSGWTLTSNDTPLADATTYTWHYLITG